MRVNGMKPKTLSLSLLVGVALFGVALLTLFGTSSASRPAPLSPSQERPAIPVLTADSLATARASGTWLIVEFGGATCIPCKAMQPILQELQESFGSMVQVRNFWVQDDLDTARSLRILVIPTQVVFDASGKEVLRHQGGYGIDEFRAALATVGLR